MSKRKRVPSGDPTAQKCSEGNTETSEHRKYRAFCFADFREEPVEWAESMIYLCYAPETCPSTGRKHWQTYVYFKNGKTITAAAKFLGCGVEVARGTAAENKRYIEGPYEKDGKKKDANPEFKEIGKLPAQGARGDLDLLKEDIIKGKSVEDICEEDPYMYHTYGRTLSKLESIIRPKTITYKKPHVVWLYGPTGTGKTLRAIREGCVPIQYHDGFFTDWGNARKVMFDEFRGQIPYGMMLNILDGYHNAFTMNIKNGHKYVDFDVIYICGPKCPEACYPNQLEKEDSINQLLRRITELTHLTEPYIYNTPVLESETIDIESAGGMCESDDDTTPLHTTRIFTESARERLRTDMNQNHNALYTSEELVIDDVDE